jgi:hypothetical protein
MCFWGSERKRREVKGLLHCGRRPAEQVGERTIAFVYKKIKK